VYKRFPHSVKIDLGIIEPRSTALAKFDCMVLRRTRFCTLHTISVMPWKRRLVPPEVPSDRSKSVTTSRS